MNEEYRKTNCVSMLEYELLRQQFEDLQKKYQALQIELAEEKIAYVRLKSRLHAKNYTMPVEEFKAILLDTKHRIMLDYNKDKPL